MLLGSLKDFEATHSLEQARQLAREKGVSSAGTKREIASRLLAVVTEKELWQMTRGEFHNYWETSIAQKDPSVKQRDFDKMVDSWRMSYVQRAIRDGKPVPVEVLRDYPDLAKAYGVAIPKTENKLFGRYQRILPLT